MGVARRWLIGACAALVVAGHPALKAKAGFMAQQKTSPTVDQVKEKHELELMAIPGVTGVGIGQDPRKPGLVIKVYVERTTAELTKKIPSEIEGYPVAIEPTGEFRAL
jgi:hypothetical protein